MSLKSQKKRKLHCRSSRTKSATTSASCVARCTKIRSALPSIAAVASSTSSIAALSAIKFSTAQRILRRTSAGTSPEIRERRKRRMRKMKIRTRTNLRPQLQCKLSKASTKRNFLVRIAGEFSEGSQNYLKLVEHLWLILSFHRESYLKKHLVSHHNQLTEPSFVDQAPVAAKANHKMQSMVHQSVQQRFFDFERERRRFQSFSELYFQQRSAFQYVCHQNYR